MSLNKGAIIFTGMGKASVCDGWSPIFSGPPLYIHKESSLGHGAKNRGSLRKKKYDEHHITPLIKGTISDAMSFSIFSL